MLENKYEHLKIQILMKNHTAEDIIIFFIKNYASPKELEENLMRYHRKVGTLKSCFKHDDHQNLDMEKSCFWNEMNEVRQELE